MSLQFPPIIPFYIAATIISSIVAYRAWHLRPARGSWSLFGLGASSAFFAITNAAGAAVADLPSRTLILQITYIGVVLTIYFWVVFTIEYSQYDYLLTRKTLIGLAIIPIFIVFLQFTVHYHTMFYTSTDMVLRNGYRVFQADYNWGFWLWVIYAYTNTTVGTLLLITSVIRFPQFYRGQATVLILSAILPLALNIMFVSGVNLPLFGRYDPSPVGYAVSGLLILMGMRRYNLLSMVPVAHDLVFKGVKSAVIVIDNDGIILDVNPAAEQTLGHTANTLLGQELITILPEHQQQILAFRDIHTIKTEIAINQHMYELQIMPFSNRVGRLSGRIIMLYDITELKQALDELDAYAHTVAHDLKTPVSGMVSYADYIKDELLDETMDEEILYSVNAITKSGKQLQDIIDSLLLLASIRRQKVVTYHPIDMHEVVDNALGRLTRLIDQSDVQFIRPTTWPTPLGYAPWVEEIWANYISNAIKYGAHPPIVELGYDDDTLPDGRLRFWVKDNGQGLTPEEQNMLFTTFTRLDKHATIKGHGLGLSIVQRIATRLDGEVGVTSQINHGSTFYFILPANPDPTKQDPILEIPQTPTTNTQTIDAY